jgi:hypothetical protein
VTANATRVAKIAVGEAEEQYVDDAPKRRVRRKVVRRTGRLNDFEPRERQKARV